MTRPSTGTTFTAGGFNDVDNRFNEDRTGLLAVLIRDARGASTNISPHNEDGSVHWSPFATDGKLRDDLFAFKRDNGIWVPNDATNEGWHLAGAFSEGRGPSTKPSIDTDEQMIEQSNQPFDSVLTKEDEPFSFTAIETAKPFLRRLRNNLRLVDDNGNSLVETPGGVDVGWAKPIDADSIDRQALFVRARRRQGKTLFTVEGWACAKVSDIGTSRPGKKGESAEITMRPLPDGYFMAHQDGEYMPVIKYTWVSGDAWTAIGTPAPAVYTVTLGSPSAGTFTLTYGGNTTAAIAYNATTAAVKSALVALDDGYTTADWSVTGTTGGPYTVTTPVGALTGSGSGLTGGTFSVVAA